MAVKTKKVFVFGNPLVEKDSLALRVAERLKGKVKGVEFEVLESLDDAKEMENIYIMDVALGIEKVQIVGDLETLESRQPVSLHDFDLAFELKLLKKLGRIGKARIIAIPAGMNEDEAERQARAVLEGISPG